MEHFTVEDFDGERVLNQLLDGSLQRACSIGAVVPGHEELMACFRGEFERNVPVGEQLLQVLQPQVNDVGQLLFAQRTEENDIVHAIEELWPEALPQHVEHQFARCIKGCFAGERVALQQLRAEVRRHNEHGIFEVDGAPF